MIDRRAELRREAEDAETDAAGARQGRAPGNDAPPPPVAGTPHGAGGTEISRADLLGTAVGDDAARVATGTAGGDGRIGTTRANENVPETVIALVEAADGASIGPSPRASLVAQEESREGVLPSWRWHP